MSREVLNFYRGIVQKRGDTWPRFNMVMNSIHALVDQEYSGDINIVPSSSWYNPAKILSHLSETDLIDLMVGGERSSFPNVESIRTCTKISRTMEELLTRFETGDLRPDASEVHRPRASRRRPPPTKATRTAARPKKKAAARKKSAAGKKTAVAGKKATKGSSEADPKALVAA